MRGLPAGDTARPWEHQAVACGQGVEAQAESHDSVFREADAMTGLDHGVGHFRPLSITRQRHLLAYHGIAMSCEGLCQGF